ncbi:uncharacterized protein LOC113146763 [Cyclospora cayetanensis]|uniref:Uncharacterized protein LOC113146763 n=1 Tax=Cyclospora cayetanensis TaxID=88456 RepID=A0A6P6RSS2_9EIME|nr:uncharacterized protein LOC113146763 [Cyclospora cayetanensis]
MKPWSLADTCCTGKPGSGGSLLILALDKVRRQMLVHLGGYLRLWLKSNFQTLETPLAACSASAPSYGARRPFGAPAGSLSARRIFSAYSDSLPLRPPARESNSQSPSQAKAQPLDREVAARQAPVSSFAAPSDSQIRRLCVSGSSSLYEECVSTLRRRRFELGSALLEAPSPEIEELSRQEKAIISKLMERTQQEAKARWHGLGLMVRLLFFASSTGIDALWDPRARVEGLEAQVAHDFEEFSRLVGAAEARRQRLLLRQSLKKAAKVHDPLSEEHRQYFGEQEAEAPPAPHRQSERFWDPSASLRSALKNKNLPITWKDVHILVYICINTHKATRIQAKVSSTLFAYRCACIYIYACAQTCINSLCMCMGVLKELCASHTRMRIRTIMHGTCTHTSPRRAIVVPPCTSKPGN